MPTERWGDRTQNCFHDMRIVGNTGDEFGMVIVATVSASAIASSFLSCSDEGISGSSSVAAAKIARVFSSRNPILSSSSREPCPK